LDSEIEQLGLRNRVKRLSATAAEMKQLYAQYDALLFTSNWGEPFALTPLEAMASGLPVITSLDGGQIELAKDNENSLIAEADNPSLYAKRIADLASSVSLRETISANGLSEVREKFDIAVITSQIEEFLLASLANDSNER
jgi:glycosyltransferase involved in cell wall biosynthesis